MWTPARADKPLIPGCKLDRIPPNPDPCLKLPEQLPNLVPYLPLSIRIGPSDGPADPPLIDIDSLAGAQPPSSEQVLRFTTVIVNRGAYALDLMAQSKDDSDDPTRWNASQCVSWEGKVCLRRKPAGEFVWHLAHQHWHFEEFALYELRYLNPDRSPDMSASGLASTSGKVSFCLADSGRDSQNFFDPPFPPEPPLYSACLGVIQGISPGWGDVYGSSLPGQQLPITEVPDGYYALVQTVDPESRLDESNETDNIAYAVIELYDQGTKVRVVG